MPDTSQSDQKYPLKLVRCDQCGLGQLSHTVDRRLLFGGDYGYRSGINQTMRDHLAGLVASLSLKPGDLLVDIGANDGTLLDLVPVNVTKVGFEPSALCRPDCIREFFSKAVFERIYPGRKADVVTSLAMFYDLDDPLGFAREVRDILAEDGRWVLEVQDLNHAEFDTICHEHVTYWDRQTLSNLLRTAGFAVMEDSYQSINGGSIRIVAKKSYAIDEHRVMGFDWGTSFRHRGIHSIAALRKLVHSLSGSKIYGYGASTKGNVLLQACEFGPKEIIAIADRNPAKWGRRTPGTGIPIIPEEKMRQDRPDFLLALPWAFMDEFQKREPWATWIVPFRKELIVRPTLDAAAFEDDPELVL